MSSRLPPLCRAVAAALAACLLSGPARGQDQGLSVFFSEHKDPAEGVANVRLRPNTDTPYYPFVRNTLNAPRTVTAVLLVGSGPDKRELARTANVAVPANGVAAVTFAGHDKPVPVPGPNVE